MTKEKGKEEITEVPPKVEPEQVVPEEKLEDKTYSQEQHEALLQERLNEQYKELNKRLTRQGEELKKFREQTPSTTNKTLRAVLDELESGDGYSDDPSRQARIKTLKGELAREEQLEGQAAYTKQQRAELDQKIRDAGLDPKDERFEEVNDTFEDASDYTGKFERAHRKLDRVLKDIKPEKPKSETEAELKERLRKEVREEEGLLMQPPGGPSGGGLNDDEFIKQYSEGKSDDHKRAKEIQDKLSKGG